jgi:hypothetical protein
VTKIVGIVLILVHTYLDEAIEEINALDEALAYAQDFYTIVKIK